jgi:hypothetical protein
MELSFELLSKLGGEFDILVITESHLDNSIQNHDIELYSFTKNIQRRDRQNQTGGGLLIYTP